MHIHPESEPNLSEKSESFLYSFLFALVIFMQPINLGAREFEVVEGAINFKVDVESQVSYNSDEVQIDVEAGGIVTVGINDHVVIRSIDSKSSFSPLSKGAIEDKTRLLGFNVPTVYTPNMVLFQSFYKEAGSAKIDCKVLVLESSLVTSHEKKLRALLESNDIEIEQKNGFYSFICGQGKAR